MPKVYSNLWTDPDDPPRNITAAVTGVATGLIGTVIPIIGLAGGLVIQLIENDHPQLKQGQYITEGVVDGSAALVAQALIRGSMRP